MTDLVACMGRGEARWQYVRQLIAKENWETVFLVASVEGAQQFSPPKQCQFVILDEKQKLPELRDAIMKQLQGKLNPVEVAVNFSAGSGKECMAVLAALLKLGSGFRLVAYTKEKGVQEV